MPARVKTLQKENAALVLIQSAPGLAEPRLGISIYRNRNGAAGLIAAPSPSPGEQSGG
jgi:hypothetical protein